MQIFPNGTMRYSGSGTDLDAEGMPIPVLTRQMSEVRCTITALTENRRGSYDDGRYRNCSYSVTCNMEDVGDGFQPSAVVLEHDNKGALGTYQVQCIEYYNLTQTIEIWV